METNSGLRAMARRREIARERRERRLRAEARIRLQLCRDAARIASHRGGGGCVSVARHYGTESRIVGSRTVDVGEKNKGDTVARWVL